MPGGRSSAEATEPAGPRNEPTGHHGHGNILSKPFLDIPWGGKGQLDDGLQTPGDGQIDHLFLCFLDRDPVGKAGIFGQLEEIRGGGRPFK